MKVVIVFAFFHQPCFLESDTFFGGVFGFFHAGKEDFMFTESLIDLVNGGVKVRTFDSLVEIIKVLGKYWFEIVELPNGHLGD